MYKFISNKNVINKFKSSKYFKRDLGKVFISSKAKNENKFDLTQQEDFVKTYYKTTNGVKLLKEGNIGQIEFYSDHTIGNNVIVYYDNTYDFNFIHNEKNMLDVGIEKYLGSMIKEIETKLLPNIKEQYKQQQAPQVSEEDKVLMAKQKIKTNPGSVTYDDIKEILKSKKRFRTV